MTESDRLDETLRALHLTLERLAAANNPPEVDPRRHFYKMFNREADEYDKDFHNKYHDDLNTTLIFAGLFSAVASAFIVDIQQDLRPNYNQMSFTVLKTMLDVTSEILNQLNATSGVPNHPNPTSGILTQPDVSAPSGPSVSAVQVQSILFASLASALLAAFLAMLGKQWLNLHVEGSIIDRSRHRELRMRGMITWRFKLIMECLPFVMQLSLLLLGYGLAQYLWGLSHTVSAVIAGFTVFGVLFYLFIVFAATAWKTCPFQTPVSIVFRRVISSVEKRQRLRLQKIRDQLSEVVRFKQLNQSFATVTLARSIDEELATLPQTPSSRTLSPANVSLNPEEEESTHASDTNCISTMFKFAGASDAVVALTRFIPEVNWTSNVRRVPLLEAYDCLRKSFEFLKDGRVLVRPGMRDQAYGSARALLHIRVQRLCADATDDTHKIVASKVGSLLGFRPGEDHELESTLEVLDAVFNSEREIRWQDFVFGDAHYCWLSHILRCRARVTLRTQEIPTKEVLGFVRYSLSREPLPPSRVIADCLLIANMIVGVLPDVDDRFFIMDKSEEIEEILRKIYRTLNLAVSPRSSASSRRLAVGVLELVAHLKQEKVCVESYSLFLTILENADSNDWLWHPAALSLIGAFKWGVPRPHVEDPTPLVRFLAHCFSEQENGIQVDIPLERTMLALAGALPEVIGDGIGRVDFTQPLFFNGICRALRNGSPYLLRRATVIFLRHLDSQLFEANKTFSDEKVDEFISGWSSSAQESLEKKDGFLLSEAVFGTLMGMLDSLYWRKHIPEDRWDAITLLGGIAEERIPSSFYRCAKNPTIIPYLKQADADGPDILPQWVAILWAKYYDLSGEVKSQLEAETKKLMDWSTKHFLSTYQEIVEGQIEQIEERINSHASWSFGEEVARLRKRLESLRYGRGVLISIQKMPI
ncbi:hypothetical protein BJ322DRAFT_1072149 [Thelephora terrestris]|uniref:DUF6535 domain-containing protein n=1 Tax=Thelephora terrestris TaxID=56493 RepID=A0A9P6HAR4_9AGAM|nr:hypothetical protein BJ322DRAFT_1072149 [Thelephora terrestris]